MHLLQALDGFLLHKRIEGLSPRTLEGYERQIEHLARFLDDPHVERITTNNLRQFFDYLRSEYTPQRLSGDTSPLSARTIRNYWIALRSFYTFATGELGVSDVMEPIPPPKVTKAPITPLKPRDVKAMLKACMLTRDGRKHPNAFRNRAILLVLADTGMRVSELCSLVICDYHAKTGRLDVVGKGEKRRVVFLGATSRKGLWRYLAERDDRHEPDAPLFATKGTKHLSRSWVRKLVSRIGEQAGISGVHPHRFRHFFAISYLRNGGDIFTLQRILGHSSLRMVRHYLALADSDVEQAQKRCSPIDNL